MSDSTFSRLHSRLQHAIVSRLGFDSLRPVQELAGEALLGGKNAVVLAPTAGGKTEASMFPTLSGLLEHPTDQVGALYVAPIKALLINQAERLGTYTEMVGLRRQVWHGDTPAPEKKKFVREPCELLMTTPESLEVMLVSQSVPATRLFADLRMVVIDEVHAFAGTDRGAHLMSVLERLAALSRHDVQRVGLSATVGNPEAILAWLSGSSAREGVVVDPPKQPSRRELLVVSREAPGQLTVDAANMARGLKSLFFCQSRATTESVASRMRAEGIDVFVHHSAVSMEERQRAEENFARGANACIICTSTLELGIDVGDLDRVLQHEAPSTVGSFLQRMGRTGRRGDKPANTTFFCETSDAILQAVALCELAKSGWVEAVPTLSRCWPVLVHQILAMALGFEGVRKSALWDQLSKVPDFAGISREEFERLLEHMVANLWLAESDGLLLIGPKSERRFGRKNFMSLYAVFSSPQSYTVETGTKPVGTLQQDFVDRLVEDISTFLLGGRAWTVQAINHKDRTIKVDPAPRGKKPTWGGYIPQFLGHHLCRTIAEVLASSETYRYLRPEAQVVLDLRRADYGMATRGSSAPWIEFGEDSTVWHTFAGGQINATIRYAIESLTGWKCTPDNFSIVIREPLARGPKLEALERRLRSEAFWDDDDAWARVVALLPEYRLSKFQDVLPDACAVEMTSDALLDRTGSRTFLASR